jgi:NAD+ kinase
MNMAPIDHAPLPTAARPARVGLLARPDGDVTTIADTVSRWATTHGMVVAALDALSSTDLLIAVGGDGTVLRALRLVAGSRTPVLPVHLGRLGYLVDVEVSQLELALEAIGNGAYTVEEHGALRVMGGSADVIALNEVVLRRVPGGRPAMIALRIQGELFMRYSGDGLIVATSMGSTAYSFSAGGPIVSPALAATLVTPLAAHAPASRPLVLAASEVVDIDVLSSSVRLSIEVDGRDHGEVGPGGRVSVAPSELSGRLVRLEQVGFATRARRKLQIADSPELVDVRPRRRPAASQAALTGGRQSSGNRESSPA